MWTPTLDLSLSVFPHHSSRLSIAVSFLFSTYSLLIPFIPYLVALLFLFHPSLSSSSRLTVVNALWQGAHSLHAIETVQRLPAPCFLPFSVLQSVSMRERERMQLTACFHHWRPLSSHSMLAICISNCLVKQASCLWCVVLLSLKSAMLHFFILCVPKWCFSYSSRSGGFFFIW